MTLSPCGHRLHRAIRLRDDVLHYASSCAGVLGETVVAIVVIAIAIAWVALQWGSANSV